MKFQYRKALNLSLDDRILFKTPALPNHAVGVMRVGNEVSIKILASVSKDFKSGPDDVTYWPNIPPEAAKLAVAVYDIFQVDDWRSNTSGIYFETYRS